MFGTALRGHWETLDIQMLYAAMYYLLLARRTDDRFSIDDLRLKTRLHYVNENKEEGDAMDLRLNGKKLWSHVRQPASD